MMILPYSGEKGCTLIKSLKKNLERALLININILVYTGTKSSSQLKNIKDPTPSEEQHDIVYHSFCSAENCNENYIGESARRLDERMKDHNGRDRNFHLFKHSVESGHDPVLKNDFKIIGNNTHRRKIAEALFIKKMKPSLNIQEKSVKLEFVTKSVSEALFSEDLCYMKTSQFICMVYQLVGYYVIGVFIEKYF